MPSTASASSCRSRRGARPGRGVRLRQDDHGQPADGPARPERGSRHARRRGGRPALRPRAAPASPQGADGLPGPLRVAQPADAGRPDRRRAAAGPQGREGCRASRSSRRGPHGGWADAGRRVPAPLSVRAVGRAAAARGHRIGAGARADPAHRRRAR